MKRGTLQLLLLAALSTSVASGQINCTSGSAQFKLVCEFPYSTGALTNASALGPTQAGTLALQTATAVATSLNITMATQVSQLPVPAASAGTVVVFKGGVPETFNNLGPILTDRGQTIGKGKVFLGFSASQYVFNDIDKNPLSNLPFAFSRQAYNSNNELQSTTYTSETINLAFKLNQYVGIATVGLSKRIDASVIVPWERVSLGDTTGASTNYVVDTSNNLVLQYATPSSYSSGTANGVGDITFNVKSMLWSGERSGFSAEMNVRTPTGDDLNFLGSGAWGFYPYLVYSYLGKVSPHARIGYVWNTATELNNPTATAGGNKALPGGLEYDIGADYAALKRLTLAGDLLGSQFLNTPAVSLIPVTVTISGKPTTLQTSSPGTASYSINNLSAGLKVSPVGSLVLAGNVLIQLNNNGLHARPTPLVGISLKF
jgi:hypothetical protein